MNRVDELRKSNGELKEYLQKQKKVIRMIRNKLEKHSSKPKPNLFVVMDGDWLGDGAYSFAFDSKEKLNKWLTTHPSQDYKVVYDFTLTSGKKAAQEFNRKPRTSILDFIEMMTSYKTKILGDVPVREKMTRDWKRINKSYNKWKHLIVK